MSAMPSFYHFIYSESEIIFQMKKPGKNAIYDFDHAAKNSYI